MYWDILTWIVKNLTIPAGVVFVIVAVLMILFGGDPELEKATVEYLFPKTNDPDKGEE